MGNDLAGNKSRSRVQEVWKRVGESGRVVTYIGGALARTFPVESITRVYWLRGRVVMEVLEEYEGYPTYVGMDYAAYIEGD